MRRIAMAVWLGIAVLAGGCAGKRSEEIPVSVTENGFEPSVIKVKKGTDVTLVVTRETEATCATEIVVKDRNLDKPLPLHQPVRLAIGTVGQGEISFTCGMEMVEGKIVGE